MIRRRTFIGMLISGELIFAAASLNLMAMNRFFSPDPTTGQVFVLFIMALAAAEVAIALSIIIAVYRNYRSIDSRELWRNSKDSHANDRHRLNARGARAPRRRRVGHGDWQTS